MQESDVALKEECDGSNKTSAEYLAPVVGCNEAKGNKFS
jgi:hypothetical protein